MSLLLKIEVWSHNLGFASLLLTMILFWFEFNFAPSLPPTSPFPSVLKDGGREGEKRSVNTLSLGDWGVCLSNIILSLILGLRWINSGHFPLSNLYESLIFLSWTITLIHVGILSLSMTSTPHSFSVPSGTFRGGGNEPLSDGRENDLKGQGKRNETVAWIGILTSPVALILNTFASFSLPEEMQNGGPLVPALQSNWLMMHVTLMILSYAALLLGSLVAIIFLVITSLPSLPLVSLGTKETEGQREQGELTGASAAKFINATDNLSYRLIGLGFPLLTIGIISGAVWANEAWGSYWSWDPKETWALITWLLFAIYLHTRLNKGWEGKKPAIIATIGFLLIWICYLGVNLLGKGLHSYGFFE